MSLFKRYTNTLTKRYATFSGRANRRECCAFIIVYFSYFIVEQALSYFSMFTVTTGDGYEVNFGKVLLLFIIVIHTIPFLALQVRRLHDLDTSGWWVLLGGFLGIIFFPFLGFMEGSPKRNDYGKPPARRDNVANTHWILLAVVCLNVIIKIRTS